MFKVLGDALKVVRLWVARHLVWLMMASGVGIVAVCLLVKLGPTASTVWTLGATIGTAVLSGGVFTWLTKTAQIRGVFREDLESVIYSTNHALVRTDVEKLWANVTRALHSDAFSAIETKIYDAIRKSYLPTQSDFYYQRVERTMKLDVVDVARQIVDVEVVMEAELVPNRSKPEIDRKYSITVDASDSGMGMPSLSTAILDRATRAPVRTVVGSESANDPSCIECVLTNLPTDQPLIIQDRLRYRQCLVNDNMLLWRAVSYVDGIRLRIQNLSGGRLVVQHRAVGKVDFRAETSVTGTTVLSTDDLIFAGQGIMLTMQIVPEEKQS